MIRHCAGAGEFGPSAIDAAVAQQMSFDVTRLQVRKRRPNGFILDVRTITFAGRRLHQRRNRYHRAGRSGGGDIASRRGLRSRCPAMPWVILWGQIIGYLLTPLPRNCWTTHRVCWRQGRHRTKFYKVCWRGHFGTSEETREPIGCGRRGCRNHA